METASFTGLLKAIVTLVFIYYAVRFFMKLLAPVLVQQVVKKAQENFNQQQQNNQNQNTQYTQNTAYPKEKKKVGEYIDFEEIE